MRDKKPCDPSNSGVFKVSHAFLKPPGWRR
jgi:hypothetical protein